MPIYYTRVVVHVAIARSRRRVVEIVEPSVAGGEGGRNTGQGESGCCRRRAPNFLAREEEKDARLFRKSRLTDFFGGVSCTEVGERGIVEAGTRYIGTRVGYSECYARARGDERQLSGVFVRGGGYISCVFESCMYMYIVTKRLRCDEPSSF